jgi:Peptidase family M23
MSWQDIMRRVLPPIGGVSPHITSRYGAITDRPPSSTNPHRGVDFNYFGGRLAKLNLSHPALRSPVAGVVENAGEGTVGRIAIRDANGFLHEILHTHTQSVKRGDLVGVGQPIGTMGNTGADDQHVHYQLKDSAGRAINPTEFWDQLGPVKSDPGEPAYFDKYQQYLRGLGTSASNEFRNETGKANIPAPGSFDTPSDGSPPLSAGQTAPRSGQRIAGKSQSFFDTGTPAVPFVPPNNVLSSDRQNPVGNRFGNWTSFPTVPPNEAPAANRHDSFTHRFGNWTASPEGDITPRDSSLPTPPPQPGRPLGIFTGRPMPSWITQPPLGGLLNNSNAAGNNDGFNLLAALVSRNSTQPESPPQTADGNPERRLVRKILNQSPAPAYDPGTAAAPLAPSVDANYPGGLLGMYAALAGTDAQDPNQPAPPDDEQQQANIRALEDRLASTGNINDAWALCKTRKASRR